MAYCRPFMLTESEQMEQNQNMIACYMDQISQPFLIFLSVTEKNWPLLRGCFGSGGRSLVAIAVVERWPLLRGLNNSQCIDCTPQKTGHC